MLKFLVFMCVSNFCLAATAELMSEQEYEQIQKAYARPRSAQFNTSSSNVEEWSRTHLAPWFESQIASHPSKAKEVLLISKKFLTYADIRCRSMSPAFTEGGVLFVCPQTLSLHSEISAVLRAALYLGFQGYDAEKYFKFATNYLDAVLPKYQAQIVVSSNEFDICTADLLAYRFVKKLSANGCLESAWVKKGSLISEFNEWYIEEVKKKELKENSHISAFISQGFFYFHTMYMYVMLHEIGHIVKKHGLANAAFSEAEEIEADKYAITTLIELGYQPEMLWAVALSMRGSTAIIRKSISTTRSGRENIIFNDNLASIEATFKSKELRESLEQMFGSQGANEFFKEIEKELPRK